MPNIPLLRHVLGWTNTSKNLHHQQYIEAHSLICAIQTVTYILVSWLRWLSLFSHINSFFMGTLKPDYRGCEENLKAFVCFKLEKSMWRHVGDLAQEFLYLEFANSSCSKPGNVFGVPETDVNVFNSRLVLRNVSLCRACRAGAAEIYMHQRRILFKGILNTSRIRDTCCMNKLSL